MARQGQYELCIVTTKDEDHVVGDEVPVLALTCGNMRTICRCSFDSCKFPLSNRYAGHARQMPRPRTAIICRSCGYVGGYDNKRIPAQPIPRFLN